MPGVFGVVSQDWLGCPVLAGPSVVGCERCAGVPVIGCPVVAARAPVANNATLMPAQMRLSFMRSPPFKLWLRLTCREVTSVGKPSRGWVPCVPRRQQGTALQRSGSLKGRPRPLPSDWPKRARPLPGFACHRFLLSAGLVLGASPMNFSTLGHDRCPRPTEFGRAARIRASIRIMAIDASAFQRPCAVRYRQWRCVLREKATRA